MAVHHEVSVLNHRSVVEGLLQLHGSHLEWGFRGSSDVSFHLSVRDYILVLVLVLGFQGTVSLVNGV